MGDLYYYNHMKYCIMQNGRIESEQHDISRQMQKKDDRTTTLYKAFIFV